MVSSPADYRWSSYRHNALGMSQSFITAHPAYAALATEDATRQASYQRLIADGTGSEETESIRKHTSQQRVLGDERFQTQIAMLIGRATTVKRRGRPKSEPRPPHEK